MVILSEIDITQQSPPPPPPFSLPTSNYDVFLSFRGADTRNNFTDHLLKALREASIRTFHDDTEIQIGDFLKPELVSAIKSSRASILVISKNYASSTWCLDELALIMEQRRTSKHIVFPIFYHVKPSDVREQKNSFGVAMAEHKQRLQEEEDEDKRSESANRIGRWEKALTEVADLKGEEAHGRETKLIEEIVKKIIGKLQLHKRSKLPHIIGMEYSIRLLASFFKDKQSTGIFTIWGMAGIGKTYLANYVFQLQYLDFERSCFLKDIERSIQKDGLLDLQKKLLKDMGTGSRMDINNVPEGTFNIENSLLTKRTLLVLDDINDLKHLDALLGTIGLHPGSKIIITSKHEPLANYKLFETQVPPPKHTKHLLKGLNGEESLQLLSWHAFQRNEPNDSDKKASMMVVKYCQGHPLALEVLGSSLRCGDATWEDILESLGKEINTDITKVLKCSFDTLSSEKDKELFKQIACLFVGDDRKFVEGILKACGICKSSGVQVLINRCLLSVDSNDILMMHQLLQDMGRDIVRQESPKKPWKRSILWHREECLDVLQNRQGTTITQGLALDMRTLENEACEGQSSANMQKFETLALGKMCNLRLLKLNYVQLIGPYKNFPQGLRWLCMHGFPLIYVPSDLQTENMVALDMSNSNLQQLWKKPKILRSLKFLNLSGCKELIRMGPFSSFPLLERLTLARCTSLVEVCESIGICCHKLEVLDLSECQKLKELPGSMRKLKNLDKLIVGSGPSIRTIHSLSLSMLKKLNLTGNRIDFLPDCVGSLRSLETLYLVAACGKFRFM